MFIHWPSPNESSYDFDALFQCVAKYAVIVLEMSGGAGGCDLIQVLDHMGIEGRHPIEVKYGHPFSKKQEMVSNKWEIVRQEQIHSQTVDLMSYTIVLMALKETSCYESIGAETSIMTLNVPSSNVSSTALTETSCYGFIGAETSAMTFNVPASNISFTGDMQVKK